MAKKRFNPFTGTLDFDSQTAGSNTTTVAVPAGQTVTVDSVLYSSMKAINYFIALHKSDFSEAKLLKMSVMKFNSSVKDVVYSRVGTNVNCAVESSVVGLNANLIITNNESYDVTCSFNKDTIN